MTRRRHVRFAISFFDDLDDQLGPDRGPNGEPSTRDFQSVELLEIAERFATGFESLRPLFDERDDYRVLEIDIDLHMDWDEQPTHRWSPGRRIELQT